MINKLKNIYQKSRIARFGFYGGFNTVIGFISYPVLYIILEHYLTYIQVLYVSFFISTHFAFYTTKFYVFRSYGNIFKEYCRFMTLNCTTIFGGSSAYTSINITNII